jgi:FAD/FMN-containing dehydrogenase
MNPGRPFPAGLACELRSIVGPANLVEGGETLENLSKDFFWYSPVLKRQLDDKIADAAVRISTQEELRATLAACSRAGVPVTARGGGTGNYGQCVPIYGGIVLDMMPMNRILDISSAGLLRTETGARLGTIEVEARRKGWELRCMPSTWMKASIGGFFCGGSGGIGSIVWGGIGSPGNVKSITLLSCEHEPRRIRLEGDEIPRGLRGFGTTGIMVEVEMFLAPKLDYDQVLFNSPSWDALLDWTDSAARKPEWRKRLVTAFEWPIPSFFRPLKKHVLPNEHLGLMLIDRRQTRELVDSAASAGLKCVYRVPLSDPPKPPFVSDYTYNHTTLWAMKSDPTFTYIQAGFGANFREQFKALHDRFPGEILLHLEWGAARAVPDADGSGYFHGENVGVGGIPLVRFMSEERLAEIIFYCRQIGIVIANPHTYLLDEEGAQQPNMAEKRAFKTEMDPAGLLNPGKMKSFPFNPFEPAAV